MSKLRRCLIELLTAIRDLSQQSEGVAGLHNNGDVASWESLLVGGTYEEWLGEFIRKADDVLASTSADDELLEDIASCLQWLHDLQNGCPLPKYEADWEREMKRAERLLIRYSERRT